MKNELLVVDVNKVVIPTEKLNTVQQKKYTEYGHKVLDSIKEMTSQLVSAELDDFRRENEEIIVKELEQKNPVINEIVKNLNAKTKKQQEYDKKATLQIDDLNNQIGKLENRRDAIQSRVENKTKETYSEIDALRNGLRKRENNVLDLSILDNIELKEGYREDVRLNGVSNEFTAKMLIDDDVVEEKISAMFETKIKEMRKIESMIKQLRENLEEVMLFDDSKVKPLFEKILSIKMTVKTKYNERFYS